MSITDDNGPRLDPGLRGRDRRAPCRARQARHGHRRRRPRHQHGSRHAQGGREARRRRGPGHRRPAQGVSAWRWCRASAAPPVRSTGRCSCRWGRRPPAREELDLAGWTGALEAGVKGVQARGKAEPDDKTMVDALLPALDALRRGAMTAPSWATRCDRSADAAAEGMRATIPLEARKGRASYLGPRSVGIRIRARRRRSCYSRWRRRRSAATA